MPRIAAHSFQKVRVFAAIEELADWCTAAEIARKCCMSDRTVRQAVDKLLKASVLERLPVWQGGVRVRVHRAPSEQAQVVMQDLREIQRIEAD